MLKEPKRIIAEEPTAQEYSQCKQSTTGYHFTGPLALRRNVSIVLPSLIDSTTNFTLRVLKLQYFNI